MLLELSITTVRDYAITVFCIMGVIAFLLMIIVTAMTGFLSWSTIGRVRKILKESVQPAAANVKETTANLKGTVSYISDTAIRPIVTVYGAAAGAKRFAKVVTRFAKKKDGAKA
ncbi:MAG: hypothetical protein ABI559_11635 [Chloroflexota bacterium]